MPSVLIASLVILMECHAAIALLFCGFCIVFSDVIYRLDTNMRADMHTLRIIVMRL